MARIAGVDLPRNKRLIRALTYIYGIGLSRSRYILGKAQVDESRRTDDLTSDEIARIRNVIENEEKVEGDLRREVSQNIRRLISIGTYRGLRHKRGLPVRGQRTRTNARTRKGGKRTVGAVRDKTARAAIKAAVPAK